MTIDPYPVKLAQEALEVLAAREGEVDRVASCQVGRTNDGQLRLTVTFASGDTQEGIFIPDLDIDGFKHMSGYDYHPKKGRPARPPADTKPTEDEDTDADD